MVASHRHVGLSYFLIFVGYLQRIGSLTTQVISQVKYFAACESKQTISSCKTAESLPYINYEFLKVKNIFLITTFKNQTLNIL